MDDRGRPATARGMSGVPTHVGDGGGCFKGVRLRDDAINMGGTLGMVEKDSLGRRGG